MIGRASFPRIISRSFASAHLKPLVATEQFPFSAKLSPTKAGPVVVKESKLASGVKIISKDDGINNIVHFKVAVLGGSRAETAEQKGAAHFLAAGAWNAGNALNSGLRTVRYMESVGAQIASSGDREKIVFDVVAEANKADLVFAGIAAAVSTPPDAMYKYSEDVRPIADERYKVLKEHHWAQVMEQLHEAAYGETAPLGGSKYALSLDLLDVEQVVAYRNAHFVADNLVVAASGISHEKLTALVEQYVGTGRKLPRASTETEIELHLLQVPSAATPTPNPLAGASPYEGGVSKVRLDLHGESHLGLGYPIAAGDAAKPFLVLQGLLAQKFGAEDFHTYHYSSGGLATYYASGEPAVAGAKLLAVVAEIKAIAAGGANVEGTKLRVAIDHLSALESDKATDLLLTAHLNGVSAQSFGDVRGVTKEQVVAAAQTVLKSAPAYAVLGTTAHTPSHAAVLAAWKQ